jgi:hypothetical protein
MITGEKLGEGGLLYVDIWEETGPLSAIVYWIVDLATGGSLFVYRFLGLLLFFIQAAYFNIILLKHKAFNENNYVPGLIFALLGLMTFNEITLSPQLLGLTFILLVMDSLFTHMESGRRTDDNPINIGIFTGIAGLFYLPYIYFLLIWLIALLLYSSTIGRRYLLMMYGFVFVFFVLWMLYAWKGQTRALNVAYFQSIFHGSVESYWDFKSILIIASVPILVLLDSILRVFRFPGYTNFQVRLQTVFFLTTFVSLFVWVVYGARNGQSLVVFVPVLAFFLSHSLLIIKKAWRRELSFLFLLLYILFIYWGVPHDFLGVSRYVSVDNVLVKPTPLDDIVRGKRILSLGANIHYYRDAQLATPYFNWRLSRKQLERLDYYDNLTEIYDNFVRDMPEVIIDQNDVMPAIFKKIPYLARQYKKGNSEGLYIRLSNN